MDERNIDIPTRSDDGKSALDVFYIGLNDVNFYVEDEDQEYLYEVILRKLFPDFKISRVFPLGGKSLVLRHAGDPNNDTFMEKRIYLLDKDFDDYHETIVNDPRIFYYDWYCIENYLCELDAIIEVVTESHPKRKKTAIMTKLALEDTLESCLDNLKPLFVAFLCVQLFELGIPNCAVPIERFCDSNKRHLLSPSKIQEYIGRVQTIYSQTHEIPKPDPSADPRVQQALLADRHAIVSGKALMKILFHHVNSHFTLGSITFDSFVYRVAKNCVLHSLYQISERIRAHLSGDGVS